MTSTEGSRCGFCLAVVACLRGELRLMGACKTNVPLQLIHTIRDRECITAALVHADDMVCDSVVQDFVWLIHHNVEKIKSAEQPTPYQFVLCSAGWGTWL